MLTMSNAPSLEVETEAPATGAAPDRLRIAAEFLQSIAESPDVPGATEFEALTDLLLDAVLAGEQSVVAAVAEDLRAVVALWHPRAGDAAWGSSLARAETLLTLADGAGDRLTSDADVELIESGSRTHQMLQLLRAGRSVRSVDVVGALHISPEQVSRIGRALAERRLAVRTKAGREVYWDITPRGEEALEAVAQRRKAIWPEVERRKVALRREEPWSDRVVEAGSGNPLQLSPTTVRRLLENATHIEDRSRVLFAALLQERWSDVSERLDMWSSFHRFASGPVRFEVPDPGEATERIEELTWQALREVEAGGEDDGALWPAPPPLWDGWAIVRSRNDRPGIVFFEAKSEPQELRRRPLRQSRQIDSGALEAIFDRTRRDLGATQPWRLWPKYSDPATRLAFLHQLRRVGVPAWWMNVYFVDQDRQISEKLPASLETWKDHIRRVRAELDIVRKHELTRFVGHEFFTIPTTGFELDEVPAAVEDEADASR